MIQNPEIPKKQKETCSIVPRVGILALSSDRYIQYCPVLLILIILYVSPCSAAALVNGILYFHNITPQNDVLEWQAHPRDTLIQGRSYDLLKISGFSQIYAHWDDESLAMTNCNPDHIINTSFFGTNGLMRPDNVYLDPATWTTGDWYQWDGCFNRYVRGQTTPNMVPYSSDNAYMFTIISWQDYQIAKTWQTRGNTPVENITPAEVVNKTPDPILGPWLNGMTFYENGTVNDQHTTWTANPDDNTSYFLLSDKPSFAEWTYNPSSDQINQRGSRQVFGRGIPAPVIMLTATPTQSPPAMNISNSSGTGETKFSYSGCLDFCKSIYYPQRIGLYNDCLQACNIENQKTSP